VLCWDQKKLTILAGKQCIWEQLIQVTVYVNSRGHSLDISTTKQLVSKTSTNFIPNTANKTKIALIVPAGIIFISNEFHFSRKGKQTCWLYIPFLLSKRNASNKKNTHLYLTQNNHYRMKTEL
jgi:hypothetical protein